MKTRILAGAAIVVVLLAVLIFAPMLVSAIFVGLMAAIASHELLWGTGLVKHVRLNVYSALMAFGVAMWSYFGCPYAVGLVGVLLYSVVLFAEMMAAKLQLQSKDAMLCLVSGLLIPYFLSALVRISCMEQGRHQCALRLFPQHRGWKPGQAYQLGIPDPNGLHHPGSADVLTGGGSGCMRMLWHS